MSIYTARPSADGTPLQWDVILKGTHWPKLDNTPPNDSRGIEAQAPALSDHHLYTNAPGGFVAGVSITVRVRVSWSMGTASGILRAFVYFGGVLQGQAGLGGLLMGPGSAATADIVIGTYTAAFTKAQADDLEIRLTTEDGVGWVPLTANVQVWEAYANVTHDVVQLVNLADAITVGDVLTASVVLEPPAWSKTLTAARDPLAGINVEERLATLTDPGRSVLVAERGKILTDPGRSVQLAEREKILVEEQPEDIPLTEN